MISFRNLKIIARYETKTLYRSWFFRIFSIMMFLVLLSMDIGLLSSLGEGSWSARGLSGNFPYLALLFTNLAQAIVAVFLSSDFLKRDKKLDTTVVVYMRPVSNLEYVIGKTIGIIWVFFVVNFIALLMALIFNFIDADAVVKPGLYISYFLLISLPTLIFVLGLAFIMMQLIRNQAVTFIVLLGLIGVSLFYLSSKFGFLFDFTAFFTPLNYSDLAGFASPNEIISLRALYFCLGLGLILLSAAILKRLHQSAAQKVFSYVFGTALILLGLFFGVKHFVEYQDKEKIVESVKSLNIENKNFKAHDIDSYEIKLNHKGQVIQAQVTLMIPGESLSSNHLCFSLNPGLKLTKLEADHSEISFQRKEHLIFFNLPEENLNQDIIQLHFEYAGKINESYCFPDVKKEIKEREHRINALNVGVKYAFIQDDYLLLTPESQWYPVPGIQYNPEHPEYKALVFSNFSLEVEHKAGLSCFSQGTEEILSDKSSRFQNDKNLSSISCFIGPYSKRSIRIDSVDFNLVHHKDHVYFDKIFTEVNDTLPKVLKDLKDEIERNIGFDYPFERLSIVEVPVHFRAYPRLYTLCQEYVQPEIILLPENGLPIYNADFKNTIKRAKRRAERSNEVFNDTELQANTIREFFNSVLYANSFFNQRNPMNNEEISYVEDYTVYPQFYYYSNHFSCDKYPLMNRSVESYLREGSTETIQMNFMNSSALSEEEHANIELNHKKLPEILKNWENYKYISSIINNKSSYLFTIIESKIGKENFNTLLKDFLGNNMFDNAEFLEFSKIIKDESDFDLVSFLDKWYLQTKLPGFIFHDISSKKIIQDNRERYQLRIVCENGKDAMGIVKIMLRTAGSRGGGSRGGMRSGGSNFGGFPGMSRSFSFEPDAEKLIFFEGKGIKEIGMILDEQPRMVSVEMMVSENLPNNLRMPFRREEEEEWTEGWEGIRALESYQKTGKMEIIVDNEDANFQFTSKPEENRLKKILGIEKENEDKYQSMRFWRAPQQWTATTNSNFYGDYIRSAHFKASGVGEYIATWIGDIPSDGYYAVYFYMSPMGRGGRGGNRGGGPGGGGNNDAGDYHISIHHGEGEENLVLDMNNAEAEWNYLGNYYFTKGKHELKLSDETSGRFVIADAVKWVKQ